MENRDSILFPQENMEGKITSFAFVKEYLIYSTDVRIINILKSHFQKFKINFNRSKILDKPFIFWLFLS